MKTSISGSSPCRIDLPGHPTWCWHSRCHSRAPPAEVTAPATGVVMHPEYAKAIGRMAYVWGWPMVNQINRRAAITQAPEPGRLNGVLPVAPRGQIGMLSDYIDPGQTFVTCPNQDVVYGLGLLLARRGAGRHPGAGLRRPLLGLRHV